MTTLGPTFDRNSTTDDVLTGIDLTGRTVFITGANSGLGQETARALAATGAIVIMAGRDQGKLDAAVAAIRADLPDAELETIICDLGNLASIRACGDEARARFAKIDLLINNAGVMACPLLRTADGFEMQFGTNHLGHFALTAELMPLIEAGANTKGSGRIVNLSSRGHQFAPTDCNDPNFTEQDYDPWISYGQSKTANILFSVGLEARYGQRGIHAYAVHPGGINTNLGRHLDAAMVAELMARVTTSDAGFAWKTIPQGAATSCWAATAPELEGAGGVYCEDCHVAAVDDQSSASGVRSYALDAQSAERLWTLSEQLTGAQYPA
ncbi:SDR family NAD(P)-dependent oxidoreductase [Erythrobacter sanguineus]|uniref:Probable oxidoreductase n=1 Tax=Erythrobacter sanguineus TaxID=198312 RepID=A0A1M7SS33_9SPHN|nr:SDR family NAD(P)-dependent oxidoreductase [Erythrobacter sanguineus]SHN61335.1 NAD(P)-dependent dehydrogenase, short-chain alcohol dehydrogenase family [Erythrobacter sanguineus]